MSSSIFASRTTKRLRFQYGSLTGTQLSAATDATSSLRLLALDFDSSVIVIDNGTNVDISLMLLHPEETDVTQKIYWMSVGAGKSLTFDLYSVVKYIDAGAKIYAYVDSGSPSAATKLRFFTWG